MRMWWQGMVMALEADMVLVRGASATYEVRAGLGSGMKVSGGGGGGAEADTRGLEGAV